MTLISLKQQVCSLERAKRLKALGIRQESLFYHLEDTCGRQEYRGMIHAVGNNPQGGNTSYAAFSVAESGERLPTGRDAGRTWLEAPARLYCCHWYTVHLSTGTASTGGSDKQPPSKHVPPHYADTEADARAQMVRYWVAQKLVTFSGQRCLFRPPPSTCPPLPLSYDFSQDVSPQRGVLFLQKESIFFLGCRRTGMV